MDIENFKTTLFNIIGASSKITGDLILSGPTTICGEVEGIITTTSRLVLDRNSRVTGIIHGHDVEVTGFFKGEIVCTGTLSLKAGSEVAGIIKASKLVIYPGAVVDMEGSADSATL